MSDALDRLMEEAKEVVKDQFPGSSESVDLEDCMAFLLGIPKDDVQEALDTLSRVAESRLDGLDDRAHVFVTFLMVGIEAGIAAERINRLELP